MEADWSAEVGRDLPQMVVPWEGFIDLRYEEAGIEHIHEVAELPALGEALRLLNDRRSPFFTSKCDFWRLSADEVDADEFASRSEDVFAGFASYVDILASRPSSFASFEFYEVLVRQIVAELHDAPLQSCRVDLVIRAASVEAAEGYGITLYAAACGESDVAAVARWESVLNAAVLATINTGVPSAGGPHPRASGYGKRASQGE